MTKADISEKMSRLMGITRKDASSLVDTFFDLLKDTLAAGEEVKISGFGRFVVKQKQDRLGRNPQTGETMTIESRRILGFKASAQLKDRVNGKYAAAA